MKDKLFSIAVALALFPLILGVGIFILWFVTKRDFLEYAGLLTIAGGVICVVISFILLLCHNIKIRKMGSRVTLKKNLTVPAIAVINVAVWFFIIFFAVGMKTSYLLTIDNQGSIPIEEIRIFGIGGREPEYLKVPMLRNGQRVKQKISFKHEGSLEFSAKRGDKLIQGVIEGYVTNNMGGGSQLIFIDYDYKVKQNE